MKFLVALVLSGFLLFAKEVKVDKVNSALILIEFQNEWLGEKGKLPVLMKDKEQFEASKYTAKQALDIARENNLTIIHAGLFLSNEYKELGGKNAKSGLRAAIQKFGTWSKYGSEFAKGFEPLNGEFVVSGRVGASAFAGSNLDSYLRNNDIKRLYIIGYATHVCVESTLRDAHDKGYEAVVLHDATSAFTKEQKEYFLTHIVHHFGEAVTVKEFEDILSCIK